MNKVFADKNLLRYIIQFLGPKDLTRCMQVNKQWDSIATDDSTWAHHVKRIISYYPSLDRYFDPLIAPYFVSFGNLVRYDPRQPENDDKLIKGICNRRYHHVWTINVYIDEITGLIDHIQIHLHRRTSYLISIVNLNNRMDFLSQFYKDLGI